MEQRNFGHVIQVLHSLSSSTLSKETYKELGSTPRLQAMP